MQNLNIRGIYRGVSAPEGSENPKRIEHILQGNLEIPRFEFCQSFQPEREFKVYKSCKGSQIICSRVHLYSMFPRLSISISNFLKLLNKLYNELGE